MGGGIAPPSLSERNTGDLASGESAGVRLSAAFLENTGKEFGTGFVGAPFLAGEFRFVGNEATFAASLQHAGAVAFQGGLHPL